MMIPMQTSIQAFARTCAETITDLDRKQLRFNEIIAAAMRFYPNDPYSGVRELVKSCDRSSSLYVHKRPMWQVLADNYGWITTTTTCGINAGEQ